MRTILAAVSLVLLAACGRGGDGNAAAADNAAAPAANVAEPAPAAAPAADPAAAARRANEIQECSDDVRTEVPEGTDLNAFCGCAVDKMQTGLGERPAMEQCAAQMGIQPRGH